MAAACALPALAGASPLVFAAASLKGVLDRISAEVSPMRLAYGGSGALARQIVQGAPADLFLSANPQWMDLVSKSVGATLDGQVDLLGNRLVVIAAPNHPEIELQGWQPEGRIATGFVDAVPVGQYARAAFKALDMWKEVSPLLVETASVSAALAYVTQGAVPYAVVYATDAMAEPRVKVIAEIDPKLHQPITYPMAAMTERGGAVFDILQGTKAAAIFAHAGFEVL